MNLDFKRLLLAINFVVLLPLAIWPIVAPENFYESFPGFGMHWIDVNGPYNEHFLIDFGALNAALLVVIGFALWKRLPALEMAAGLAIAIYALPHGIYHLSHTDVYESNEKVIAVAPLVLQIFMGVCIAWMARTNSTNTTNITDTVIP